MQTVLSTVCDPEAKGNIPNDGKYAAVTLLPSFIDHNEMKSCASPQYVRQQKKNTMSAVII